MNKMKETLRREIEDLKRVRDELKVQAHLGKAEFKDAWSRLEAHWPKVEQKLRDIEAGTSEFAGEVAESTKALVDELKQGYQRLRKG